MYLYDDELNNTNLITNDIYSENGCDISLTLGTYYIKVQNNYYADNTINLSIISSHTHNYNQWIKYSSSQHIECCECGSVGTKKATHVTKISETVNGKSYCIVCGYYVTLSDGFIPIIHNNIQKVTLNGSYILPNGIIVLVDEDVEAYLKGTLVFYNKNNLPQTQ